MNCTLFQDTRAGRRPYNQDRLGCWRRNDALLLAVADGLGGHAHGEIAAQITIDHLGEAFAAQARPKLPAPELFLRDAIGEAHEKIVEHARRRKLGDPPCTTVVTCVVQDGQACWSHVGDSRLYLIRQGRVAARTRDHTFVQQLVDSGKIREQSVENHPTRNQLLRCLGGLRALSIDPAERMPLEKDDIVLLCSDGLWGPLTERQILIGLIGLIGKDLARALPALIAQAEARGGPQCDNITVVAMQWHGIESSPSAQ